MEIFTSTDIPRFMTYILSASLFFDSLNQSILVREVIFQLQVLLCHPAITFSYFHYSAHCDAIDFVQLLFIFS